MFEGAEHRDHDQERREQAEYNIQLLKSYVSELEADVEKGNDVNSVYMKTKIHQAKGCVSEISRLAGKDRSKDIIMDILGAVENNGLYRKLMGRGENE